MSFTAKIGNRTFDNTDNGALFAEKQRPGYLAGTFNDGSSGKCLPLIAKADPETKTYKLGLVVGGKIVATGELRKGTGRVQYEGQIGETPIVGFKATRKNDTYIQIRPDTRRSLEAQVQEARGLFDQL